MIWLFHSPIRCILDQVLSFHVGIRLSGHNWNTRWLVLQLESRLNVKSWFRLRSILFRNSDYGQLLLLFYYFLLIFSLFLTTFNTALIVWAFHSRAWLRVVCILLFHLQFKLACCITHTQAALYWVTCKLVLESNADGWTFVWFSRWLYLFPQRLRWHWWICLSWIEWRICPSSDIFEILSRFSSSFSVFSRCNS